MESLAKGTVVTKHPDICKEIGRYAGYLLMAAAVTFIVCGTPVFADDTADAEAAATIMISVVVGIICNIVSLVAVISLVISVAKIALAYLNENSADQQKAMMMAGVSLALMVLPQFIKSVPWASLISVYKYDEVG